MAAAARRRVRGLHSTHYDKKAAAAVELLDSKDATCGVHAADSLGDPSKVRRHAPCALRAV
jgi:hypothetical protein